MEEPETVRQHRPAEPLLTRHVFLDTQVYHALKHDPGNAALLALKQHIDAHRVVLHTTDITLLEVRRQLNEAVLARARETGEVEKDFRRWRKQSSAVAPMPYFDPDVVGKELFGRFKSFITGECEAIIHQALRTVAPETVFGLYFDRKPPFDGKTSKEFPDGFVIAALLQWAENADHKIYIVTRDRGMERAAEMQGRLIPLKTLEEVLASAAATLGPEADKIADNLLHHPAFDTTFNALLETQISEAAFVYTGDLPEGEAYEGQLIAIEEVGDWSVVGFEVGHVSIVLEAKVKVRVKIQYEDRESAMYDREDDRWFGTESASAELEDYADIRVLADINGFNGEVVGVKLLTSEIDVFGPSDDDY